MLAPICITPYSCETKSPFGFSAAGGQQRSWRTCSSSLWTRKANMLLAGRTDNFTVENKITIYAH